MKNKRIRIDLPFGWLHFNTHTAAVSTGGQIGPIWWGEWDFHLMPKCPYCKGTGEEMCDQFVSYPCPVCEDGDGYISFPKWCRLTFSQWSWDTIGATIEERIADCNYHGHITVRDCPWCGGSGHTRERYGEGEYEAGAWPCYLCNGAGRLSLLQWLFWVVFYHKETLA